MIDVEGRIARIIANQREAVDLAERLLLNEVREELHHVLMTELRATNDVSTVLLLARIRDRVESCLKGRR